MSGIFSDLLKTIMAIIKTKGIYNIKKFILFTMATALQTLDFS